VVWPNCYLYLRRNWFNCFRHQPHKTEELKSVEAYMKLLEPNTLA